MKIKNYDKNIKTIRICLEDADIIQHHLIADIHGTVDGKVTVNFHAVVWSEAELSHDDGQMNR